MDNAPFKRHIIRGSSLTILFIAFFTIKLVWPTPGDRVRYAQLMEKRQIASSLPLASTKQQRQGVHKDIWLVQDQKTRLCHQIKSDHSTLLLTPVDNRLEIVESLVGVSCWMQEKLFFEGTTERPAQQVRLIEAKEGTYHHGLQEFSASQVSLSLFRVQGHEPPKGPLPQSAAFLRGLAQDVLFFLGDKNLHFQATDFKMQGEPR